MNPWKKTMKVPSDKITTKDNEGLGVFTGESVCGMALSTFMLNLKFIPAKEIKNPMAFPVQKPSV